MPRSLLGFLPWIAYAVLANGDTWRYGAIAALVLGLGVILLGRKDGKKVDQMVIEISAVVFFALVTVLSIIDPHSPLRLYSPALVNGWLALTAWGSLAVRAPFTLGIARSVTPEELWRTPGFYRVNAIITSVWATAFTLSAVTIALVLHAHPQGSLWVIPISVLSFVLPAVFTARYPATVQARHAA